MKSSHTPLRLVLSGLIGLGSILLFAAFKKGDTAFSKKITTPLLAEPKPLATASSKVEFGTKLTVEEVRGTWLRVSTKKASGWVFQGNVADEKPSLAPSAGLTTVSADSTDTVAAARPLTKAADGYSERHGGADAKADVEWVDVQAAAVSSAELEVYMQENEKGEFQK